MGSLATVDDWNKFLTDSGIPETEAEAYAKTLVANRLFYPADLTRDILKELGITIIGDAIAILKHSVQYKEQKSTVTAPGISHHKPQIPLPRLTADMTHRDFRKFKIDWDVYKTIMQLPESQIAPQIYTACDQAVQTSIINSSENFFKMNESKILSTLEKIVTRLSNPSVHRLTFSNITQSDNETIHAFLIRLKSAAQDCEYACPSCKYDLSSIHVKDQFIRGLQNSQLQTDILAKSSSLKKLEDVVKHAEAFETAVLDQSTLNESTEAMRVSEYRRQQRSLKSKYNPPQRENKNPSPVKFQTQPRKCTGCGSTRHGNNNRSTSCPASLLSR